MVRTLELRTTQEGVIWPRRPLISAKGLLSSIQNVPFSSVDKRPTCFRDAAFNAAGDVLAAVDERGRVFVFFVTANRYALVQHLGVPAITCCFNPARKTELLVTCENDLVRWTACETDTIYLYGTDGGCANAGWLHGRRTASTCSPKSWSARCAATASPRAARRSRSRASSHSRRPKTPSSSGIRKTGHATACSTPGRASSRFVRPRCTYRGTRDAHLTLDLLASPGKLCRARRPRGRVLPR
jgi:hypothetical protein